MAMNTITVNKKRNVTFIPIDQNGNPNPIGADGQPLWPVGIPTWTLGEVVTSRVRRPGAAAAPAGFTLVPAADGMSCDVIADTANVTAALHCEADRGDGVMVHGGAIIESVDETGGIVPSIGSLQLQFGPETDK